MTHVPPSANGSSTLPHAPQVAVLVSTYQRPQHLRRCLHSLAAQQDVEGQFEVVVTDDGSTDSTPDVVATFAEQVSFRVHFTTHPHQAFQLARCRNEGVAASTAPYLLFLDGDLICPPDFIAKHLAHQRSGVAWAGDSCYLDEATSEQCTLTAIEQGYFLKWLPADERRRLAAKHFRSHLYRWIGHRTKPSFKGGNIAIWRDNYDRVNGYDENFVGWGLEETDLQWRLAQQGVRFASSMGWTQTCHLWHPPHATFTARGTGTANETYLRQPGRLSRCRAGLRKRSVADLSIGIAGQPADAKRVEPLLQGRFSTSEQKPEVEIAFAPGQGSYARNTECRVLLASADGPRTQRMLRQADIVVSDMPPPSNVSSRWFPWNDFEQALESIQ